MTKKEKEEEIKKYLYIFENPKEYTDYEYRMECIEIAIAKSREYLSEYKIPFKHKFMNAVVNFKESVLDALDESILKSKEYYK